MKKTTIATTTTNIVLAKWKYNNKITKNENIVGKSCKLSKLHKASIEKTAILLTKKHNKKSKYH